MTSRYFVVDGTIILILHNQSAAHHAPDKEEKSGLTLSGGSGQMKHRLLQDETGQVENRSALYEHR
jgi:hypothetical protein